MNITDMVMKSFSPDTRRKACSPETFLYKDRVRIATMCDIIEQMDERIKLLEDYIGKLELAYMATKK